MNRKTYILGFMLLVVGLCIFGCKKDDPDPAENPADPIIQNTNMYLASGSYGDVIRYKVNEAAKTYTYHNETTGLSDSGSYSVSTNANLAGIYEVTMGSDVFYAVEMADQLFVTSLPSGRAENALCVGLSAELDLSTNYSMNELAGKYLFILIYDINDQTSANVYGGYELFSNGTYTWAYGPSVPENFANNFSGEGTGTWTISSSDPSRIIFTEGGDNYTGTVYPEKAMLIDNGVGNGFTFGVKYPNAAITQASIAGTYRFLDIMGSEQGVGYFSIPASGFSNLNQYMKYNGPTGEITNPTITNFEKVNAVNNMFKITSNPGGANYYTYCVVLPGEILFHFCLNSNMTKIESYGISGKTD